MTRLWWLLLLAPCACAEEEAAEPALPDIPACESRGEGDGIWGRVVVPSCDTGVPSATVVVLDQLQFEVATATADARGEFRVPASALKGDGTYLLRAESGPYRGPATPAPFAVQGARSQYQVVKLNGAP
jgi:hypothetical protein